GLSIRSDVGQLARVGVVAVPTAGIGTKVRELECRRCKVPASGGQGHVDTVSAEANDVGHAVPINVRKRARVEVLAGPTAGGGAVMKLGYARVSTRSRRPGESSELGVEID